MTKMEADLEITPAEVAALMKTGSVTLIDVRTPHEYNIARIEGCRLVDQALVKDILETWPKDTPIITVCHHGIRSLDAAVYLRQQGFAHARSMSGGIDVWSRTIDPSIPRY
jgi:rhodanese-related sulfurtransferase